MIARYCTSQVNSTPPLPSPPRPPPPPPHVIMRNVAWDQARSGMGGELERGEKDPGGSLKTFPLLWRAVCFKIIFKRIV